MTLVANRKLSVDRLLNARCLLPPFNLIFKGIVNCAGVAGGIGLNLKRGESVVYNEALRNIRGVFVENNRA